MVEIRTAAEIDAGHLRAFLSQVYPPAKSSFLSEHGAWWHDSDENRWVLLVGGKVGGYCAVIPTRAWISGNIVPALWWVDLVIAPEFRGHGYQTLFDARIRAIADLKLGFPNELAAKIHRKHQWGVREDLRVRLCPFYPHRIPAIQLAQGIRGRGMRLAVALGFPFFAAFRWSVCCYRPKYSRKVDEFDSPMLAGIFRRYATTQLNTIYRDETFFEWRYLKAPYRSDLRVYISGPQDHPTHYLIARHIQSDRKRVCRVLDLFGNFADLPALIDLIKLAAKDALDNQVSQITMMTTTPELEKAAQKAGLLFPVQARFCWQGSRPDWMQSLAEESLWTLGDSDNDEPI